MRVKGAMQLRNVIVAESHEMYRLGLVNALRDLVGSAALIHQAAEFPSLMSQLVENPLCDLVLIDWGLRGMKRFAGIARLRATNPLVPLLLLGASESVLDIKNAFRLNVAGYVPRTSSAAVLCSAVSVVLAGGIFVPSQVLRELIDGDRWRDGHSGRNDGAEQLDQGIERLTSRQLQVVRELTTGDSNKRIARTLGITEGTVKLHLAAIYRAMKVRNRTEAVLTVTRAQKDLEANE
jgi:DNA-binding NarL/FixJ family response regulator